MKVVKIDVSGCGVIVPVAIPTLSIASDSNPIYNMDFANMCP